jgi:hypothetical protein
VEGWPVRRHAPRSASRRRSGAVRSVAAAVIVGIVSGVYLGLTANRGPRDLFSPRFPAAGLVTNEYAYWNPTDANAVRSSAWVLTSGSLFALDGAGWTGVPDGLAPDRDSSGTTDSAVFRLRTRIDDFENVAVSFELRVSRLVSTPRTPPQAYDGVHIWLRYQTPDWLYFASVSRRDGSVVIGKKLATEHGGVYTDLVRRSGHPFPLNRWEPVRATIRSDGRAVAIALYVDGHLLARAVDLGAGGSPILRPGRVGIRGDNTEFEFRGFEVTSL